MNAACTKVLSSPIEKIHHDLHLENISADRLHHAEEFVRACECVGLWRLKQGQRSDTAGFYLGELAKNLAVSVLRLAEAGDIMLARNLPPIVAAMQRAESVYGKKLTNEITGRLPIEELLKKHRAIELIQMFAALHADWAKLCGIEDGEKLLRQPEEKLRELLLSEEEWVSVGGEQEDVEKRKHRLAQVIERMQAIREMQQPGINLFVEHLWQGRLWSNGRFEDCAWPTRPPRKEVTAWMKLIMHYLKRVTNDDPMKLTVFQYMIAARTCIHDGQRIDTTHGARLATAPNPSDIWNQVGAEIRKAWIRMEKQARKPVSEKPA